MTGPRPRRLVSRLPALLARLGTLRASAAFGLSGAAFALGNLLLARTMPVEAFGRFALGLALFNVFGVIAPLGLDQVMLRHRIDRGPRLLLLLLGAGAGFGGLAALGAVQLGGFGPAEAAALAVAIATGGLVTTIVAGLRAATREWSALLAVTWASWVLLAIGVAALAAPMPTAARPLGLFAAGNALAAVAGWAALVRLDRAAPRPAAPIPWREAASLFGIAAIGTVTLQLERLLIPAAVGLEPLALFSVLASVAIFPFRMVTAGAGFGLVPKLRAASDLAQRRRLVQDELISITVLLGGASVAVLLAAPAVTALLTGGRYQIGLLLVLSACVNGSAKVLQVVPRSILTGCGDASDIAALNRFGWLGLALAALGVFAGAPWGLAGVICGSAAGSLAGSLPAILLSRRRLR